MNEAKFTKGDWEVAPNVHCHVRQVGTERGIANTGGYSTNTDDGEHVIENIANAHLIAVAPKMYEALEDAWHVLVNAAEDMSTGKDVSPPAYYLNKTNDIDVLLAKARGE